MDTNLITTSLNAILCLIFLSIAVRALYLYVRVRSSLLFILALSMGTITLTTAFDTFGANLSQLTHWQFNTDLFLYVGQAVGFLFFFLSLVIQDQTQLRWLVRWQIAISLLILLPLLIWPLAPDLPDYLRVILSGSRSIICFIIFFYYVGVFTRKESRFALLMGISFLLLSFGYLVLIPTYLLPNQDMLDHAGDVLRICGLIVLTGSFTVG